VLGPGCPAGASADGRAAGLYLRLRRANPAPYAAYLGLGEGRAVLSSSPELFLSLDGGHVVTRPIKGTRPHRPGDEAFNARMRADLLAAEKDRAELVMIVDLERNDLGRVSTYGSVRVTAPRDLETYAAVYHTVATVEGCLHAGHDVVDLLKATFPGGSITGAPKIRAMQIIAELEPTRRSLYTGAVGYLAPQRPSDPAGRCALNIAIRTLLVAEGRVHLQVGGGIVADSQPEAEFDETEDKARALLAALNAPSP
jgi:para-aminobenzoate synthetase component 1